MTRKAAVVALFALAAIGMVFAATAKAAPPKPASGIIINHAQKQKLGISCEVCHSPNDKDARLMSFPAMDVCATCHNPDTDMSAGTDGCGKCHTNADYSSNVPKDKVLMPTIIFDHTPHLAAKIDCLACHVIYDKVGVTGDEMLPKMPTCVACHTAQKVPNGTDCATCHTDANIGTTRPASHTPLWLTNHGHGLSQKTIDQSCDICHTVAAGNDCASCHQREAPPNHNTAWTLGGHGLAADASRNNCSVCHTQAQCIACHTTEPPASHTASWGSPLDKHCYTCHIQNFGTAGYGSAAIGSNCQVCHTSGSVLSAHTSVPRPADHLVGFSHNNCALCHSGAGASNTTINHPYPTAGGVPNTNQCLICHT